MCAEEGTPSANHFERIRTLVDYVDPEPSVSDGVDIHALGRGRTGNLNPGLQFDALTDSLVQEHDDYGTLVDQNNISTLLYCLEQPVGTPDQIIQMHNNAFSFLEPYQLVRHVRRHGHHHMSDAFVDVDRDYERIFTLVFSRRENRRIPLASEYPPVGVRELMSEWLDIAGDFDPQPSREWVMPGDMSHFRRMLALFMPERLNSNSWVAKMLLDMHGCPRVSAELGLPHGYFTRFEPWMATVHVGAEPDENGRSREWRPYVFGEHEEGHIVFIMTHGFPKPLTWEALEQLGKIGLRIEELEEALIALSRRIAGYIAKTIMLEYVLPASDEQGRMVVGRRQLTLAVREILGDAWFDLPFNRSGALARWTVDAVLKPAEQIVGWDVFLD